MATHTTAPYPYRALYLMRLDPSISEYGEVTWQTYGAYGSLPAITGPTDAAERQVEIIVAGITALAPTKPYWGSDGFGLPARIELVWTRGASECELRGMAIFDTQGRLIVHVTNALLGYGGAGPYLTERIMHLLGISTEVIEAMQQHARNRPYLLVASRQKHAIYEGTDTASATLDVEPEWTWWSATQASLSQLTSR